MTAPDRTPAPPLDETDLARIVTHPTCGQCGQAWSLRACGPTHALIAHERQAIVPALVAALRATWRERDEARQRAERLAVQVAAEVSSVERDRDRYRAALEEIRDAESRWEIDVLHGFSNRLKDAARDALAAPGAGGRATEERT